MDKLLDEAKKKQIKIREKKLYKQVAEIIYDDVPVIPIYYSNNTVAAVKGIEGVKATSYINFDELSFKKQIGKIKDGGIIK